MQALAACLVAATLSVLAIDPAWAISAEGNLAAHDRWRPGEGLQAGDWYTYMVCEAPGGCGMVRLGFEDVGERWNATVAIREIPVPRGIAEQEDVTGYLDGIWDIYGLPPHSPDAGLFNLTVNPAGLNVKYSNHGEREIAHKIRSTVFFLGGEVRMHAGHDPILDVGEIWTYQGAATIDRPIVITDVFNGYGICGSSVNSTVYSAAYRNAARVDMMIADGFPFPVSGTATKPDGTMGQIYGDPHVVSSHWYVLVEHSGSLGDHGLGPMCSIAAGMRDIGAAADPEAGPAVREPTPAANNTGVSPGGVTVAVSKPLYQ